MEVELIGEGTRVTRKMHYCFHCGQPIPKKTMAEYHVCKMDDVYTLYFHPDCDACWQQYLVAAELHISDFAEGFPPLADEWHESGMFDELCNDYRGLYPHVIARLELPEQRRDMRDGLEVYG